MCLQAGDFKGFITFIKFSQVRFGLQTQWSDSDLFLNFSKSDLPAFRPVKGAVLPMSSADCRVRSLRGGVCVYSSRFSFPACLSVCVL